MSVLVPSIIDELHRVEAQVVEFQAAEPCPVPYSIDEYSVLFGNRVDLDVFVARGKTFGMERFNYTDDLMRRTDVEETFEVHFDFLQLPAKSWRIEAMHVASGVAPLHATASQGIDNYCGVFHASYKLENLDAYNAELHRLYRAGYEPRAQYQNSYGVFSYWKIEPHLPYFKPRANLRDR